MTRFAWAGLCLVVAGCGAPAGSDAGTTSDGAPSDGATSDATTALDGGNRDLPLTIVDAFILSTTGGACASDEDCASGTSPGQRGLCLLALGAPSPIVFPGGACTSACRMRFNQADGVNLDCPGGHATCQDGNCEPICATTAACRQGYVCYNDSTLTSTCQPRALSQCDPKAPDACAGQNDGGASPSLVCVDVSPDQSAGECRLACEVFGQGCPLTDDGETQGCYARASGLAVCAPSENGQGTALLDGGVGSDGTPCTFLNGCAPGFGCHGEGATSFCRSYCRTGSNAAGAPVTCGPGQHCADLSATVPSSAVGLCSP